MVIFIVFYLRSDLFFHRICMQNGRYRACGVVHYNR